MHVFCELTSQCSDRASVAPPTALQAAPFILYFRETQ